MNVKYTIIPAVLKREEINKEFMKKFFSEDMMYYIGWYEANCVAGISDEPSDGLRQFAILDKDDNLVGYISYHVDLYSRCVYNFGMISFKKSMAFSAAIEEIIEDLIHKEKFHRISWRMVSGNPVEKTYDRFLKKYNGNKIVEHDVFKDKYGNYHDSIIYELLF